MRKETVTAIIEALKGISDNVNNIIAILQNENVDEEVTVAKDAPSERAKTEVKKAPAKKAEPVKEETEEKEVGQLNLDDMTYNELKKFAKDNGLSAVGDRKTLIKRIEENLLNKPAEAEEETEEEVPVKESVSVKAKKAPVKKAEPVEEVEEEPEQAEEVEEEVEDDEEELVSSIEEALEEMTDEEIKDLLVENGIKAKGKRQALIDAVIRGVKEGKIEFADEDEESEEAEETEAEAEEVEAEEMTEERAKGINEYRSQVEEALSAGEMTKADLISYIEAFRGETDKTLAKKSEKALVDIYMECAENFIDDEGDMHDSEEPYMINEEPFCCGSPLNYNEKEKVYVCEHCGGE